MVAVNGRGGGERFGCCAFRESTRPFPGPRPTDHRAAQSPSEPAGASSRASLRAEVNHKPFVDSRKAARGFPKDARRRVNESRPGSSAGPR
jgi:hypothetical protein